MYVSLYHRYVPYFLLLWKPRLVFDVPKRFVLDSLFSLYILMVYLTVGWIVTSRKLGDVFQTNFFDVWNTVMTIAMCITWIVLFALTFVAFWEGKIFISPKEDTARDVRHWRVRRHAEDVELGYHTHDTEQTTESNLRLGAAGSETSAMNSGMSTPIPKEVVTAGR